MKNSTKFLLTFIVVLSVWSCQKESFDQETIQDKNDFFTPIGNNAKEGDFDVVPWPEKSNLKSSQSLYDSEFIDGGMVMVGGQFMRTVIIGNQRWTIDDYKMNITDPSLSIWENKIYGDAQQVDTTLYYSYNLAMTLNGSPTMMSYNAPSGLVETSSWRIPTWSDENDLGYMAAGDMEAITNALEYKSTGMIYHEYSSVYIPDADTIPVHLNPTETVHWNSEYIPNDGSGNGPFGTWHLTGGNASDYIYLFQFQLMMPYAPIRLVQNIEPLQ